MVFLQKLTIIIVAKQTVTKKVIKMADTPKTKKSDSSYGRMFGTFDEKKQPSAQPEKSAMLVEEATRSIQSTRRIAKNFFRHQKQQGDAAPTPIVSPKSGPAR